MAGDLDRSFLTHPKQLGLIITTHKQLESLLDKTIENEIVVIKGISDFVEPQSDTLITIRRKFAVFKCKYLILSGCGKNFLYFYVREQIFPNLKILLLLNTHPCDNYTLHRLHHHPLWTTYLSEFYFDCYKERWIPETSLYEALGMGVHRMTNANMKQIIRSVIPVKAQII